MIAILKYNAGNIKSVKNALDRLGYDAVISDNPDVLNTAEKVIIPGVGEAGSAMAYLQEKGLDAVIKNFSQPVLGICLGQQLLCSSSEEGNTECLGIFDSIVRKFPPKERVPHMGWNNFTSLSGKLFKGIHYDNNVYFVHGYYADLCDQTSAICNYIVPFSAAMQKDNFYATQFHPEKSADIGERILKNFLEL